MASVEARREAAVRRWRGAALGTAVLQVSYIPLILVWRAALGGAEMDATLLGQALGFGVGVMPIVFITLAFASRHRNTSRAVMKAIVLFLVVGGPLFLVIDPILGAVAGYASGGVVALRSDLGPHATQSRVVAAIAVILAVMVLLLFAPLAAAAAGGLMPFLTLAYADHRVAKQRPVTEDDEDDLLDE